MEWLKKVLEKAKIENGVLDVENLTKEISKELTKNTVTKEIYDALDVKFQTATNALKNYSGTDIEKLKQELQDEKNGRINDKKELLFRNSLKENGAVDVDYLMYKYGMDKIELDDKGKIKDFDAIMKTLKETYGTQFKDGGSAGEGSNKGSGANLGSSGNFMKGNDNADDKDLGIGEKLGKIAAEENKAGECDYYFK